MQAFDQRQTERNVHTALTTYINGASWTRFDGLDHEAATSFLKVFLDASYKDFGVAPMELSATQLREILLVLMPKRISDKRRHAELSAELVADFYDWSLDEGKTLPAALDKELKASTKAFGEAMAGTLKKKVKRLEPLRNADEKPGRNDPCHCGSGKKYKKCHMASD